MASFQLPAWRSRVQNVDPRLCTARAVHGHRLGCGSSPAPAKVEGGSPECPFLPRNGPKWEVGAEPPGGAGMTQRQLLEAGGRDCRSAPGLRPAPGDGSLASRH